MRIAVTGSVAVDHLARFAGRFAEQFVPGKLDSLSLSFLTERLEVHRGGVAANIATGLARLGVRPLLVAAVGGDFADYRSWLEARGVDTGAVLVCEDAHTAQFWCTTDEDQNQIASFHPGAMSAAGRIGLEPLLDEVDLVVVAPNDPAAMLRHTAECRARGTAFAADPSQQLALLDGDAVRRLTEGARYLFTNEYERELLLRKTGWGEQDVLRRVGTWVTTLGERGALVRDSPERSVTVPAVATTAIADPTGAGDAFRSGYLAARAWGLPHAAAARLGCSVATVVLETRGTLDYDLHEADLLPRLADAYGQRHAAQLAPRLGQALAGARLRHSALVTGS